MHLSLAFRHFGTHLVNSFCRLKWSWMNAPWISLISQQFFLAKIHWLAKSVHEHDQQFLGMTLWKTFQILLHPSSQNLNAHWLLSWHLQTVLDLYIVLSAQKNFWNFAMSACWKLQWLMLCLFVCASAHCQGFALCFLFCLSKSLNMKRHLTRRKWGGGGGERRRQKAKEDHETLMSSTEVWQLNIVFFFAKKVSI